jgi:hypothetical protein
MERIKRMKIVYTVEIDEDVYELEGLMSTLDTTVSLATDCLVLRSRIESLDETCENGEWEEKEDEQ